MGQGLLTKLILTSEPFPHLGSPSPWPYISLVPVIASFTNTSIEIRCAAWKRHADRLTVSTNTTVSIYYVGTQCTTVPGHGQVLLITWYGMLSRLPGTTVAEEGSYVALLAAMISTIYYHST